MDKEIRISQEFLDKTITNNARLLVGIVMRRFEIGSDLDSIKKEVKELIYENSRALKATLESFSSGIKFISKPDNSKKE